MISHKYQRHATQRGAARPATSVSCNRNYLVDDCTPERLTTFLAEHDGRMAVISPEGSALEVMAGRYSNSVPNIDVYLMGHSGDDLRCDRVGRNPDHVPRPALTVLMTAQPSVLDGLFEKPGLQSRGFLARFLIALPTSLVGQRKVEPEPMSTQTRDGYRECVRALLEIPFDPENAETMHLSPAAWHRLKEFASDLEQNLGEGQGQRTLSDFTGKDLQQEVDVPCCQTTLHDITFLGGMAFD